MAKGTLELDELNDDYNIVEDAIDLSDGADSGVIGDGIDTGDEPEDDPEEEEQEEQEQEEEQEKEEEEEKPEDEKKKKEEDAPAAPVADFKPLFEKLNVEDEEELTQIVQDYDKAQDRIAELEAEVKNTEPKFKTDFEKKAYEFVVNGPKSIEGFATYLQLQTLDVDKMEPKDLLRERFILEEGSDLTRSEAERLFEKRYYKTYERDADEDTEIELKRDANKAKKFIAEQKEKYKADPAQEVGLDTGRVSEVVSAAMDENMNQFNQAVSGLKTLSLKVDDNSENDFKYVLSKTQTEEVTRRMESVLRNPAYYDPKTGKLKGGFDPEKSRDTIVRAVVGDKIAEEFGKHCFAVGYAKRTAEIGNIQPTRKGNTRNNNGNEPETVDDAWERLAADRKARKNRSN